MLRKSASTRDSARCRFVAEGGGSASWIELTPTARFDEEEKTRVGRRARPPMLLQLVPSGSGPLFAGTRRAGQRASTAAVDGRLPLHLEKGERCGHQRRSLLQIVQRGNADTDVLRARNALQGSGAGSATACGCFWAVAQLRREGRQTGTTLLLSEPSR